MKTITIYNTHIEVTPYSLGENLKLEQYFSVYDKPTHSFNHLGFMVYENKLLLPRGADLYILKTYLLDIDIHVVRQGDPYATLNKYIKATREPRNNIQKDSLDFLNGTNKFRYTNKYSQLSLNLDTGDGKTFCTIRHIIDKGIKAIIITHIDKIKQQWINEFIASSNIKEKDLVNIDGSDKMDMIMANKLRGCIYFVNHQTLNSYCRVNGYHSIIDFFRKIQVGIKVYDEAHFEFRNILLIDFFSNTYKTIYLTANFSRSDIRESILFKKSFNSVAKFGEQTREYDEKRKHIVYMPMMYDSNASDNDVISINTTFGFSTTKFIDYALNKDTSNALIEKLDEVIMRVIKLEGRILITSPKTSSADYIKEHLKTLLPDKSIGSIHSKNKPSENEVSKECDIISSTIKSCGTGVNINKLRVLINLEPYSSKITANQLAGRLREYNKELDTYYIDLIDISIKRCYDMYKTRLNYLRQKCKKVILTK